MRRDLRPALEWEAVRSCIDRPLFDRAMVLDLFSHVGRPDAHGDWVEAVGVSLNDIAISFALDLWEEAQPSATAAGIQARRLAEACSQALEIAGCGEAEPTPENIHPFFGVGGLYAAAAVRSAAHGAISAIGANRSDSGQASTMNALRAIHLLRLDALLMAEVVDRRQRLKPAAHHRPVKAATRQMVANLARLYAGTWQRDPGISLEPPGPFVRLMVQVSTELKKRLGKNSFTFTAESLAKIWRDLPDDKKGKAPELPESWSA